MQSANFYEDRLTLNEVAKHLKVHVATVHRWTLQGVRGRKLPSFLIGGRRYVAISDLERFIRPADRPVAEVDSRRSTEAQEMLRTYGIESPKGKDGAK